MRLLVTIRLLDGRWCRSVRMLDYTEAAGVAVMLAMSRENVEAAMVYDDNRAAFAQARPDAKAWLAQGGEELVQESVNEFLQAYEVTE